MKSGIISLEKLVAYATKEDPAGRSLHLKSPEGKILGREIRKITKDIEKERGFYLWGNYDGKYFWNNIYLGKAGFSKHAGLYKRITEELADERCFLWVGIIPQFDILTKGLELYSSSWERHLKKANTSPTSHIIWVATPEIDESHVRNIEADLIETLNPSGNVVRPTPPSEIQEYTKTIIGHFRELIHSNRPSNPKILRNIKKVFDKHFSTWKIKLPDDALKTRQPGYVSSEGWHIQYLFNKDGRGQYLDYYASHRMTNARHMRIYESGESESLPSPQEFIIYSAGATEKKNK